MYESDTMLNERDWRCAAVQLMLSIDPSYDNRTIASTLKMQIWIATNNRDVPRVMKTKVSGYGYGVWCGFKGGPHHANSHFRSWLESQHQSVPGCAEECGDPLVQSCGRWQTLGVAAGLGAGPQVLRDLVLASEGVLRLFYPSLTGPLLPRPEPAGLLRLVIQTSPTWPPNTPKPAWSPPSAEYSPSSRRRLWKRHSPSSGSGSVSVSRRWLRLKAATLNRC